MEFGVDLHISLAWSLKIVKYCEMEYPLPHQ